MLKEAVHDCTVFGIAQREALWREFTHHGWTVTVTAGAKTQPPGPPSTEKKGLWLCHAFHEGWLKPGEFLETRGSSMWDVLSQMADKINDVYVRG